jgi:hypothetical protein
MNGVIFIAAGALAGPPAVLVTMIACLILLALRAWSRSVGLPLTRSVSLYVDGAIWVFFLLFMVFVTIRFNSFA